MALHEKLKQMYPESVIEAHNHCGDETIVLKRDSFKKIMHLLKTDSAFQFNVLMDATAVDGLDMNWRPRFEMVYHLYSMPKNHRLRVKVRLDEKDLVMPTVTDRWAAAHWFEREIWDMFGIRFDGHPNLKRILLYEEFQGHPLRKDYPYNKRQPLIGPRN